jgi:hypothetical protein
MRLSPETKGTIGPQRVLENVLKRRRNLSALLAVLIKGSFLGLDDRSRLSMFDAVDAYLKPPASQGAFLVHHGSMSHWCRVSGIFFVIEDNQ